MSKNVFVTIVKTSENLIKPFFWLCILLFFSSIKKYFLFSCFLKRFHDNDSIFSENAYVYPFLFFYLLSLFLGKSFFLQVKVVPYVGLFSSVDNLWLLWISQNSFQKISGSYIDKPSINRYFRSVVRTLSNIYDKFFFQK